MLSRHAGRKAADLAAARASPLLRSLGAPAAADCRAFHSPSSPSASSPAALSSLRNACMATPPAARLAFSHGFAADAAAPTTSPSSPPAAPPLTPTQLIFKNPSSTIHYDEHNHERYPPGDPSKRAFTYLALTGGRFIYASALRLLVLKFILSMSASKDVLALASIEVDVSNIEPGSTVTVKWRGKPVFIRRRTPADVAKAADVNLAELRDPEEDSKRAPNPEWLVVIGVCTHLGCVPLPNAGDYGGWFCPCHGSHYDISGRIRKGPAPTNLEVPSYLFLDDNKLLIG